MAVRNRWRPGSTPSSNRMQSPGEHQSPGNKPAIYLHQRNYEGTPTSEYDGVVVNQPSKL
jgi:hypothetical protein